MKDSRLPLPLPISPQELPGLASVWEPLPLVFQKLAKEFFFSSRAKEFWLLGGFVTAHPPRAVFLLLKTKAKRTLVYREGMHV